MIGLLACELDLGRLDLRHDDEANSPKESHAKRCDNQLQNGRQPVPRIVQFTICTAHRCRLVQDVARIAGRWRSVGKVR